MRRTRIAAVTAASATVVAGGWVAGEVAADAQTTTVAEPTASTGGQAPAASEASDGVFTGAVVTNVKGDYQAELTLAGGEIVDMVILKAGTSDAESVRVNAFAEPELISRVLAAQTWDVEAVSGASYTSDGVIASVKDALAQAGRA